MQIRINGQDQAVDAGTLDELVRELNLSSGSLVIEHNQKIIKQEQWASTSINDNDVIELLSFVGGG